MTKSIKPSDLGAAIEEELTLYHEDVMKKVDALSAKAAKEVVKKTKSLAPVGERGSFKKSISSKLVEKTRFSSIYAWFVKAPDHRLTHLLVHGHAKRNGGRTKADPFLENALAEVLPEYEKNVEEALKNGK